MAKVRHLQESDVFDGFPQNGRLVHLCIVPRDNILQLDDPEMKTIKQ